MYVPYIATDSKRRRRVFRKLTPHAAGASAKCVTPSRLLLSACHYTAVYVTFGSIELGCRHVAFGRWTRGARVLVDTMSSAVSAVLAPCCC